MQVKAVMTRNAECVGPRCGLAEAARRMKRHNIGMLPVTEGELVVGVLTDRDIVVRAVARGASWDKITVGDIMTREPALCYDEADLAAVARIMEERKIRRMPVTDREGRLVGVLSLEDFTRKFRGKDYAGEVLRAVAAKRV